MYKLTKNDMGFKVHQFNYNTSKYTVIAKLNEAKEIYEFVKKFNVNIREDQLITALETLEDKQFNTAEFGSAGFFTVPWFDETISKECYV